MVLADGRSGRLLVWQDHPEFAGHEMMFCQVLPGLLQRFEAVQVNFPSCNQGFAKALERFDDPGLIRSPIPFTRISAELYRAPFRRAYRRFVDATYDAFRPTASLVLQGRIENTGAPLLTLARRPARLVSYLPMAHSCREISSFAAGTGAPDLLRRFYYRIPERFIVPSRAVAAQVMKAGGRKAMVVENIAPSGVRRSDKREARALLNFPQDKKLAVVLGRLKTRHKGLDRLLQMIAAQRDSLQAWRFLLIGKGEGEADLKALVESSGLSDLVTFIPWLENPSAVYSAADLMLMPARYEGVPLVLLEAMAYGAPVLASHIDVFTEYLPESSRFSFEGAEALKVAMERALSPEGLAAYAEACGRHLPRLTQTASSDAFVAALCGP
ncbi:glycosyltransferase family 4 protein [Phenylobacterium sp. LjRoot225]|uniref:glycosyltransferase family 4 protein n=1 Tax=Phenylobacterium sp. LjRoot225 TaxID=3342285 RepID=UPI003ECC96B5